MSTRDYPVSDFEQRAADISVDHSAGEGERGHKGEAKRIVKAVRGVKSVHNLTTSYPSNRSNSSLTTR